jgi:hypothetical protein
VIIGRYPGPVEENVRMTTAQARNTTDQELTMRWLALFPALSELEPEHHARLLAAIRFNA